LMASLNFCLLSDLHLEIPLTIKNLPELESQAEYLFLVGDIGRPGKSTLEEFLNEVRQKFAKVFFVPGNHEFYRGEYYSTKESMRELCNQWDNVIFMDRTTIVEHGKFRLIGASLWSFVSEEARETVQRGLSDYNAVSIIEGDNPKRRITVDDTNKWHKEDVQFLKEQIEIARTDNQVAVVLTHHAPLMKGTSHPRFEGQLLTQGFSTDLESLMGSPVAVWCYGHTVSPNSVD